MFIDGKWKEAENNAQFEVFNPATGEVISKVADAGNEDIISAIEAADRAMYVAKRQGGDQVEAFSHVRDSSPFSDRSLATSRRQARERGQGPAPPA